MRDGDGPPNPPPNSIANPPLDREAAQLQYDLAVMSKMIDVLPVGLRKFLLAQHQQLTDSVLKFMAALLARDQAIAGVMASANLEHTYIIFDLEATRRERDKLRQQLEGPGND